MSELQQLLNKLENHLSENVHHSTIEVFEQLKELCSTLTTPAFKFEINQRVWFLKNDKAQRGNIRVRQITESSGKLREESKYFSRDTDDKVLILYCLEKEQEIDPNWQLEEHQLFASKQELLESL